jgi:PAS domain S-box-containing protein
MEDDRPPFPTKFHSPGLPFLKLLESASEVIVRLDHHWRCIDIISPSSGSEAGIVAQGFLGKTIRKLGLPREACDRFEIACREALTTGQVTRVRYIVDEIGYLSHLIPERILDGKIESLMAITEVISDRFQTNLEPQHQDGSGAVEYRVECPDGLVRWVRDWGFVIQNEAGQVYRYSGIAEDIDDCKQAEVELRQREELLSSIYMGVEEAIFVIDVIVPNDFRYVSFNPVAERYGRVSNQQVQNKTPEEVFGTTLGSIFRQNYERCLQAGKKISYEEEVVLADQSIWTLTTLSPLSDKQGCIYRMIGTAIDISDRKRTEAALQQQLEREQLIAELTQYIRQSLDVNEVLHRTVERVRQTLNTDRVIILHFQLDYRGTVIMESVGAEWMPILETTIFDPCFSDRYVAAYCRGRVAAIADLYTENVEPCYFNLLSSFQVRAALVVPILQADNLWGLLMVHHCAAPRPWQTEEIELLQQLATQVGIAIQQSELYQQTRHELLERQRMQLALQASEERFRSLSTSAPIGICQTNADGICLYTNTHWQEMLGLSFEDCLGNGWIQAIHLQDRERMRSLWEAYLQGEQEFIGEFRLRSTQGKTRWIAAHAAAMRSATGEIIGHVGTAEDITDRKRVEEALRASEQRLQSILDNSPAVIYLLDAQNRILLANRRYAERLLTTVEDVLGKSIYDLWDIHIANSFAVYNRQVLETNQLLQIEETVPQMDGLHTYITVKFPLRDETGQPYAVCGISTDITEKKKLEEQFYRAQRMESLGTLASGIAHDLNNVFTPILAIAQLLRTKNQNLNTQSQEMLQLLVDGAKRGANLVTQVLSFSRGTVGNRILLQVRHILSEVIKIMQQTFPKSIEICQEIPAQDLQLVTADPTQLHQVFINLCVNARDAMPYGGTLTLKVEDRFIDAGYAQLHLDAQEGHYVVVSITDTGTGIPPDLIDRIFDPFFTTKEIGKGTGLGLSTVLGIVKNHGGFVRVQSELGKGSQFQVYLLASEGTASHAAEKEDFPYSRGELILIVDDEATVRHVTQTLLEDYDYRTLIAQDGIEAIAVYAEHKHDINIVLLDIMMPNMDGFTVIHTLQKINPQVKIIAASGLPANHHQALSAGAQVFLSKPYTTENLLQAVHQLC